jgi:GAF domain-containing protein
MSESLEISGNTKEERYRSLLPQISALIESESDELANLSNIIAALHHGMEFFWTGIYFVKGNELVLGPFQGPVACTRIAFGKGVCGASWKEKQTILVEDVDAFPGHIACSSLSRSEIVIPGIDEKGDVVLVLDVDSEKLGYFDSSDQKYLETAMKLIIKCLNPNREKK